jgi:hypothetical protein
MGVLLGNSEGPEFFRHQELIDLQQFRVEQTIQMIFQVQGAGQAGWFSSHASALDPAGPTALG